MVRLDIDNGPRYTLAAYCIAYGGDTTPEASRQPALEEIGIALGMSARAPAIVAAEQDLVEHLQERGHPSARIADRKTFIDRSTNEMTVRLTVDAGRPATVGPLAFAGRQAVAEAYLRSSADWPEGAHYQRRVRPAERRVGKGGVITGSTRWA